MGQPTHYGPSEDQMSFSSEEWGQLTFFPSNKPNTDCRHCLLWRNGDDGSPKECLKAPCIPEERVDGLSGYYSIHDMPNQ